MRYWPKHHFLNQAFLDIPGKGCPPPLFICFHSVKYFTFTSAMLKKKKITLILVRTMRNTSFRTVTKDAKTTAIGEIRLKTQCKDPHE